MAERQCERTLAGQRMSLSRIYLLSTTWFSTSRTTGSGRGVVLLHGFLVDGDPYWRQGGIARSLSSTGYRVITPDARGHGLVQSSRHREVLGWCTCARFLVACGLLVA